MADTPNLLQHWITFLKAHEKLVIIALGVFLAFHFWGTGLTAWQQHDQRQADLAQAQVKTDNTANQQTQQQLTQLTAVIAKQQTDIGRAMQQRVIQTVEQKKQDTQMTAVQLAGRFQALLKVGEQDVQPEAGSQNLVFTPVAAQANIAALEDAKQCKADNIDLTTELVSETSIVAKQQDLIVGTQKELTDEKVAHTTDVKVLNDKVRKSGFRGFKIGFIVGAIATEVFKLFVLHKP